MAGAGDHSCTLAINPLHRLLGSPKEINLWLGQWEAKGWDNQQYSLRKSGQVQRLLALPAGARGSSHCLSRPGSECPDTPCNQQAQALATDPSVDRGDLVHRKSGHCSAWVGWHSARDARLPLQYSNLVNAVTADPMCPKQYPWQWPKVSGAIHWSSQL